LGQLRTCRLKALQELVEFIPHWTETMISVGLNHSYLCLVYSLDGCLCRRVVMEGENQFEIGAVVHRYWNTSRIDWFVANVVLALTGGATGAPSVSA
jgi:hypothetical protein